MSAAPPPGGPLRPLVEVRGLKKYFPIHKGLFGRHVGDVRAVDDVSFDIYPQETLGIVGESGCGKTTAGRTLLRLLEPTAGTASFDGQDIFCLQKAELRAMRRHMQIIFQDPYSSLNPRMTVGSIIGDALELHGLAHGDERFDRAKELLERVGLQKSYINRYPHEFSGGQRQRIGIARAVALQPKFIVCDEAVSALDVSVQAQILNLLMDLQEEYRLSYMFIAHDLSVVRHISDRVAVMYLGRIVELSVCDDLYEAPLHPYTQALLSAIPRTSPGRRTDRVIVQGDVPNPIAPPSGCHFHPRCPLAFDRCRVEVPDLRQARDGHRVRCHLYEDAAWPAEPIPISSAPPQAPPAATPAAAAPAKKAKKAPKPAATAADDLPPADVSAEFAMFDGGFENGDSIRPVGIPEVLREREGMNLGPFGEIIDPEDSFAHTAEIPSLDALVSGAASVADIGAPTDDLDYEAATDTNEVLPSQDDDDPDGTDTHMELATLDPEQLGAPPSPDPELELEEPTIQAAPQAPSAPMLGETEEIPTQPDIDPDLFDDEPTVDAPAPTTGIEPSADEPSPLGSLEPENTGAMPPIHDEEGLADDVSLHEEDGFMIYAGGEDETLDLPTLRPEPTDVAPPAHPLDDEESD